MGAKQSHALQQQRRLQIGFEKLFKKHKLNAAETLAATNQCRASLAAIVTPAHLYAAADLGHEGARVARFELLLWLAREAAALQNAGQTALENNDQAMVQRVTELLAKIRTVVGRLDRPAGALSQHNNAFMEAGDRAEGATAANASGTAATALPGHGRVGSTASALSVATSNGTAGAAAAVAGGSVLPAVVGAVGAPGGSLTARPFSSPSGLRSKNGAVIPKPPSSSGSATARQSGPITSRSRPAGAASAGGKKSGALAKGSRPGSVPSLNLGSVSSKKAAAPVVPLIGIPVSSAPSAPASDRSHPHSHVTFSREDVSTLLRDLSPEEVVLLTRSIVRRGKVLHPPPVPGSPAWGALKARRDFEAAQSRGPADGSTPSMPEVFVPPCSLAAPVQDLLRQIFDALDGDEGRGVVRVEAVRAWLAGPEEGAGGHSRRNDMLRPLPRVPAFVAGMTPPASISPTAAAAAAGGLQSPRQTLESRITVLLHRLPAPSSTPPSSSRSLSGGASAVPAPLPGGLSEPVFTKPEFIALFSRWSLEDLLEVSAELRLGLEARSEDFLALVRRFNALQRRAESIQQHNARSREKAEERRRIQSVQAGLRMAQGSSDPLGDTGSPTSAASVAGLNPAVAALLSEKDRRALEESERERREQARSLEAKRRDERDALMHEERRRRVLIDAEIARMPARRAAIEQDIAREARCTPQDRAQYVAALKTMWARVGLEARALAVGAHSPAAIANSGAASPAVGSSSASSSVGGGNSSALASMRGIVALGASEFEQLARLQENFNISRQLNQRLMYEELGLAPDKCVPPASAAATTAAAVTAAAVSASPSSASLSPPVPSSASWTDLVADPTCVSCLLYPAVCMTRECGHLAYCDRCAATMLSLPPHTRQCAVCHQAVSSVIACIAGVPQLPPISSSSSSPFSVAAEEKQQHSQPQLNGKEQPARHPRGHAARVSSIHWAS